MRTIDPGELEPVRGGFFYVNGSSKGVLAANLIAVGAYAVGVVGGMRYAQDWLHSKPSPSNGSKHAD